MNLINLSEAKRLLKEFLKERRVHHREVICFKDHLAEHALYELIESIYNSIKDNVDCEEETEKPYFLDATQRAKTLGDIMISDLYHYKQIKTDITEEFKKVASLYIEEGINQERAKTKTFVTKLMS